MQRHFRHAMRMKVYHAGVLYASKVIVYHLRQQSEVKALTGLLGEEVDPKAPNTDQTATPWLSR